MDQREGKLAPAEVRSDFSERSDSLNTTVTLESTSTPAGVEEAEDPPRHQSAVVTQLQMSLCVINLVFTRPALFIPALLAKKKKKNPPHFSNGVWKPLGLLLC